AFEASIPEPVLEKVRPVKKENPYPDYPHWMAQTSWYLGTACSLVHNQKPTMSRFDNIADIARKKYPEAYNLYKTAEQNIGVGALEYLNKDVLGTKVNPKKFVEWAKSQGVNIPVPLEL